MTDLTQAVAYARALARELPDEALDLHRLTARLGLEIHQVEADGFDGALIRTRDLPLGAIAVRKSIRENGRKNFTLAHEIGHFLLPGHGETELACASTDIGNWGGASQRIEREADEFAAELLLPSRLVVKLVGSNKPSLPLIGKIAQRFHTSLSAAAWRYCDLSKEPCAIVWSKEGRIEWAKRSVSFPFALNKGASLRAGSMASRSSKGLVIPKQPQEVPADSWISTSDAELPQLFEHSKPLPAYGSVISLVWLRR